MNRYIIESLIPSISLPIINIILYYENNPNNNNRLLDMKSMIQRPDTIINEV